LIEEFKRGMNGMIWRKLMEAEMPPTSIKQWYEHATNLDRYWRESKREEERLRGQQKQEGAVTNNATTISVAEEAGNTTLADDNRAYSDGGH